MWSQHSRSGCYFRQVIVREVLLDSEHPTPSNWWPGVLDIEIAVTASIENDIDLARANVPWLLGTLRDDHEAIKFMLIAVEGDDASPIAATGDNSVPPEAVLGFITGEAPRSDNTHRVSGTILVHPQRRREGIGSALLTALERWATSRGRSYLHGWAPVAHQLTDHEVDSVPDATEKAGVEPGRDSARFLLRHGFELGLSHQHNVQTLPLAEEVCRMVEGFQDDYEVVTWVGTPTAAYLDDLAALFTAMSTDAPIGTTDLRPETWDGDRVRHTYEGLRTEAEVYTAAARHRPSGRLVGFTLVRCVTPQVEVGHQIDTVVLSEHRGHRLGLRIKAANEQQIYLARPTTRRIHTFNAVENGAMIHVNRQLGYRPASTSGQWHKSLGLGRPRT
jgi:GNAT superfamily N-acetyltransferase